MGEAEVACVLDIGNGTQCLLFKKRPRPEVFKMFVPKAKYVITLETFLFVFTNAKYNLTRNYIIIVVLLYS